MDKLVIFVFFVLLGLLLICIFAWSVPTFLLSKKTPAWITAIPIAHRGMHAPGIPENSLAAFRHAALNGYAIELDVHLSADEEVIVYHDKEMKRLTVLTGLLADHHSDVLTNTCIGSSNEKIPTLSQVLDLIDGQVPLYIEVKNIEGPSRIEERVYEVVKNYQGPFAVISFNPDSLCWFKEYAPHILRGQTSCGYNSAEEKKIFSGWERFIFSNFLMNWRSQPHFVIYDLAKTPHFPSRVLSLFTDVLVFGAENLEDYKKALVVSDNFMFDHIGEFIGKA